MSLYRREKRENETMSQVGLMPLKILLSFTLTHAMGVTLDVWPY